MKWGSAVSTAIILSGCATLAAFGFGKKDAVTAPNKVVVETAPAQVAGMFKVVIRYQLPGGPDSVLTRIAPNGQPQQAHRYPATVVRDSFMLNEPPLLQTVSGQACVQSKRRGLLSDEVCKGWSYTKADAPPPPPIIDSVVVDTTLMIARLTVKPDSIRVQTGQSQQLCAFFQYKDGQTAPVQPDIPYCASIYASFPQEYRQATPAQLYKAAGACIVWTATGGTITADVCTTL